MSRGEVCNGWVQGFVPCGVNRCFLLPFKSVFMSSVVLACNELLPGFAAMLYVPSESGLYRDPQGGGDQKRGSARLRKMLKFFFLWWKAFLSLGREALFEQFPYKGNSTF